MRTQKKLKPLSTGEAVRLFRKLLSKEEIIGLYNNDEKEGRVCAKTKHYFLESDGSVFYAENFNAGTSMHLVYNNRDFIEILYKEL